MNFQGVPWWDHALHSPGGFAVAIVAVLLMDAALLALFRWKKWL
jgi:Mg2+ and Co2+ transporter CorA